MSSTSSVSSWLVRLKLIDEKGWEIRMKASQPLPLKGFVDPSKKDNQRLFWSFWPQCTLRSLYFYHGNTEQLTKMCITFSFSSLLGAQEIDLKKKVSVGTWVWNCWWKWVERLPGSRGKSKCILDCSNSKNWSWSLPSDFHWRWILARIGWWDRCCCLFHPNLSVFYRLASVSSVGFHLKNELFIGKEPSSGPLE